MHLCISTHKKAISIFLFILGIRINTNTHKKNFDEEISDQHQQNNVLVFSHPV